MSNLFPYEPFDEKGHAVSMRQDNGGSWYHIEDVEVEIERLNERSDEYAKANQYLYRRCREFAEALREIRDNYTKRGLIKHICVQVLDVKRVQPEREQK